MHPHTAKSKGTKNYLLLVLFLLLLGLVGLSLRQTAITRQHLDALTVRLDQAYGVGSAQEKMVREIVAKVSKHVAIPGDVQVTVATITNAEELKKDNPFYASAQNGDNIIITPDRAIIYRPSEDRVVDMVNVSAPQGSSAAPGIR
ncbi:MAG: hypothetical protein WCV62_01025 [Candidatus Peribacteraceae bacterium]|jgi:hypothetical protein